MCFSRRRIKHWFLSTLNDRYELLFAIRRVYAPSQWYIAKIKKSSFVKLVLITVVL